VLADRRTTFHGRSPIREKLSVLSVDSGDRVGILVVVGMLPACRGGFHRRHVGAGIGHPLFGRTAGESQSACQQKKETCEIRADHWDLPKRVVRIIAGASWRQTRIAQGCFRGNRPGRGRPRPLSTPKPTVRATLAIRAEAQTEGATARGRAGGITLVIPSDMLADSAQFLRVLGGNA
jgi:hypothetical protein